MDKKQMKKLGKKLEEQMTPDEWAVWIAGRFAVCESTREYLSKAYECTDIRKSDFYRPQFTCERMGEKSGEAFEKYRQVAFECRLRSHLALDINSYLDDFLSTQRDKLFLRMTQHELYLAKQALLSFTTPEDMDSIAFELQCDVAGIFGEYYDFVMPTMEALSEAIALVEDEMFGEHPFLTRTNRVGLDHLKEEVILFGKAVAEDVDDNSPMPEELYRERKHMFRDWLHDKWIEDARAHVRAHIYGDDAEQTKLMRQNLIYGSRFNHSHHIKQGGAA
jgi:hypothetical protein